MSGARDRYVHLRGTIDPDENKVFHMEEKASFEAGVQYALDEFLHKLSHITVGPMHFEHSIAADILKRLREKGPHG